MPKIKWSDTYEIVAELEEEYPDVNILSLSFVKLHDMIINLAGFVDDPDGSNEGILELIQMTWLEERES